MQSVDDAIFVNDSAGELRTSTRQSITSSNDGARIIEQQLAAAAESTSNVPRNEQSEPLLVALSSPSFIGGLDTLATGLTTGAILPNLVAGSVVVATSTLSVGYFFWTIQTGYLVATAISSVPTWQSIDPLPIMSSIQNGDEDYPDTDQDIRLEDMMSENS